MSIFVNSTQLEQLFNGTKPIRMVKVWQNSGESIVFKANPVKLDLKVIDTIDYGMTVYRNLTIRSNSPYTEKIKLDFSNIVHASGVPDTVQVELVPYGTYTLDYSVNSGMATITIEYDLAVSVFDETTWIAGPTQELRGQNPFESTMNYTMP